MHLVYSQNIIATVTKVDDDDVRSVIFESEKSTETTCENVVELLHAIPAEMQFDLVTAGDMVSRLAGIPTAPEPFIPLA